jgi:hypothetical protein
MFPKHVTDYYSEVFSACLGALAFILWTRGRFALGALLLCLSVWNTPGTLLGGAFAAAYFAFRERKLRYFFALGLLPAGILLETYLKFGHFFPKDYMGHVGVKGALPYSGLPGFSYPLFFGVLSVLFSYGKGLLFFTPGLLGLFRAEIWRERERDFLISGTLYTIGLILVFSRWWAWSGDWFWGPRFYLFASLLGAFVLAISYGKAETLPWRLFWFGAAALSLWVGCQGILFGQDFLEDCISGNEVLGSVCNYVPEYSVLWRFFVVLPPLHGRKIAYMAYFVLVAITVLWRPGRELMRDLTSRALTFLRGLREARWSF